MKLQYFPSYCGGRILTGLSGSSYLNHRGGGADGMVNMHVACILTKDFKTDPKDTTTDLDRNKINGFELYRPGGAFMKIPFADIAVEEVKNILAQNSAMQIERVAYPSKDEWGDQVWRAENIKGFQRSWNAYNYATPGQLSQGPYPPFCSYVPSTIEAFHAALYTLLKLNGDFKYVYAVTSPGQSAARKYLEESGFKMIGKGKKNEMSNACENWQGDSKEIMPIMAKSLDLFYGRLGSTYDMYAQRAGVKAIRKPVEAEHAA